MCEKYLTPHPQECYKKYEPSTFESVREKTTLIASETDSKLFAYSETLGQCILKYVETKIW